MGWAIDQHYHIAGILEDVHSVHLWNTEALQPQFPWFGRIDNLWKAAAGCGITASKLTPCVFHLLRLCPPGSSEFYSGCASTRRPTLRERRRSRVPQPLLLRSTSLPA
jgi:hypothetical protein